MTTWDWAAVVPPSRAFHPASFLPWCVPGGAVIVFAAHLALTRGFLLQKRSTRMNILGSQSPLHPSALSTGKHGMLA